MAHDVFVSYSSLDKPVADATCATLEARGIRVWIAPRDVLPGAEYGAAIVKAIEDCQALVLVFSAHANDSPQVRREVERAVSKGKVIVPMRIEDSLPSNAMEFAIGNTHWLDAITPPLGVHLERLASSVLALQDKHASLRGQTVVQPSQSRTSDSADKPEDRFRSFFAERPEVISRVENEAENSPGDLKSTFASLILRLEVNLWTPLLNTECSQRDGNDIGGHMAGQRRLVKQLEKYELAIPEATIFTRACRDTNSSKAKLNELLDDYKRGAGSLDKVKPRLFELSTSAFSLICREFRRMYFSEEDDRYGEDGGHYGYCGAWYVQLVLAEAMCTSGNYSSLPFFSEALLRRINDLSNHNSWAVGIVRNVRNLGVRCGVPVGVIDESFERLVGVRASDLLRP